MGQVAAVTFALQNATPYGLLYLMTAGEVGSTDLLNQGAATPDLETDALSVLTLAPNGMPLLELLRTELAVGSNAALARWCLLGGGTQPTSTLQPGGSPNSFNRARRATVEITPIGAGADLFWAVTAIVDPVSGRPALTVQVDGVIAGEDDLALLRIHYDHPKYSGLNLGSL
jgi:hypothetical protein